MSGLEILVIVVGLAAGYWLVNFLTRGLRPAARAEAPGRPVDESASPHAGAEPPPEPQTELEPDAGLAALPWHEVLALPAGASSEEIRLAYRRLASQYHPDKVATLGPELQALAHRKSQQIGQAYRDAMQARGESA